MKLKDWADKQGIAYLTAWRWFKAGDPRLVNAYQSESGTIIVPDDFEVMESEMSISQTNDVMSSVLKKTVEFSKNNASIEDFAAWILSNFSLRRNTVIEAPKYSRNKPKPEEVQKHFQKFMKPKGEKPKPNMFVAEPEALDDLFAKAENLTAQELAEVEELMKDLSTVQTVSSPISGSIVTYGDITEGVVARSVDLTPQSLDYTGSSDYAFGNLSITDSIVLNSSDHIMDHNSTSFKPTKKELESVDKMSTMVEKSKRGRKPFKKASQ